MFQKLIEAVKADRISEVNTIVEDVLNALSKEKILEAHKSVVASYGLKVVEEKDDDEDIEDEDEDTKDKE